VIPPLPLDAAMAEVTRMAWSTAHAHLGRSIQTA
jgi:hypothetical protein